MLPRNGVRATPFGPTQPRKARPAPAPPTTPAAFKATPFKRAGFAFNPKTTAKLNPASALSLVASFDDLVRNCCVLSDVTAEKHFLTVLRKASSDWKRRWATNERERAEMVDALKQRDRKLAAKDYNLKQARMLVEDERKARLQAEGEREAMAKQLTMLKEILLVDGKGLDNETLERVRLIDTTSRGRPSPQKNQYYPDEPTVAEESVESILDVSDFSFDETQNELLAESRLMKKRRSSAAATKDVNQKRRKSHSLGVNLSQHEILSSTTKVTVDKDGNAHAESVIEAIPVNVKVDLKELKRVARKSRESRGERRVAYSERQDTYEPSAPPLDDGTKCWKHAAQSASPSRDSPVLVRRQFSNASSFPNRMHNFLEKQVTMPERCGPCGKRIGFRKRFFVCKNCSAVCHKECRNEVPTPCVPASVTRTPTNKPSGNTLADFTPLSPPMVPALLVHCVREIELRGLTEVGIYRVPGSEVEANELLEKFMKNRGAPLLGRYDVHVIASTLKKFLRSLKEPVIPLSLWRVFVDAACNPDATDGEAAMYQAISELPRPNRDTLAFLMLHLQMVACSPECKMPEDNLARVFGPTVLGYSSHEPESIISEGETQKCTILALFRISTDYWTSFLQEKENLLPRFNTPEGPHQQFLPSAAAAAFATPAEFKGIARRTRSRLFEKQHEQQQKRQQYFQSPML